MGADPAFFRMEDYSQVRGQVAPDNPQNVSLLRERAGFHRG